MLLLNWLYRPSPNALAKPTIHLFKKMQPTRLAVSRAATQVSIPALMACLSSRDRTLRANSARALGAFGPQASNAIAALANALKDSNTAVQSSAAYALHQ